MDRNINQFTIILPGAASANEGASNCRMKYPVDALRRSSSYFDAMLGGRWALDLVSPVVDLSQLALDRSAVVAALQFMVARYTPGDGNEDNSRPKQEKEVKLEEIKVLLWEGFEWEESESTIDWGAFLLAEEDDEQHQPMLSSAGENSDEEKLYQAMDYLHLQPHEELVRKLWAVKIVHCTCFLEGTLQKRGFVVSRGDSEGAVESIPDWHGPVKGRERMWRYLVCMFMCHIIENLCSVENYQQYRAIFDSEENTKYPAVFGTVEGVVRQLGCGKRMDCHHAKCQIDYLCAGLGNRGTSMSELFYYGLLVKGERGYCWLPTLDSMVEKLWTFSG